MKKSRIIGLTKAFLLCTFPLFLNQCDLLKNSDEDEDEDIIEKSEKLLTSHKWEKTKVHYLRAATETYPDPLDETVFMQDMDDCIKDNYWVFDMDYKYEKNNGLVKCTQDEGTIGDWGDWDFYDSEESNYLILYTFTWNPDLHDGDYEYEVLELTSNKLIIRYGGCSDNTEPDEDGICTTLTFEPL